MKHLLLTAALFSALSLSSTGYAQDCTANAGGNVTVCGSTTTLTGGVSGTIGASSPTWTFISGPTTPTIVAPNSLITDITGMTVDGDYVFQLSQACGTGTATSQVTITAHPRPASFTAGADILDICATTGTASLSGNIPAGFTGEWRSMNIFMLNRFGEEDDTNSVFSNATIANPTFSLINSTIHTIDPAYYAILKITSLDGFCTYEDTTIVRFTPNPNLDVPNVSKCRPLVEDFLDMPTTSPWFSTEEDFYAGSLSSGTTILLNVISQPSGADMAFEKIESRRIYFDGMTEDGTYTYTLTISNACGTFTTPTRTFTYTGTPPLHPSFLVASAPEQSMVYTQGQSGGEVHCSSKIGTTTPENFYFTINPADPPTVTTTVTPTGIAPPGGYPTVTVSGAGTMDRVATVTPPAGGWQAGTYKFSVQTNNGSCGVSQSYYIHISDGNRTDIEIPDQAACYSGTGAAAVTIPLPTVYKGVVNSSYLQDYGAWYNFTVLSKPAGSSVPVFTSTNLRNIESSSTVISNLDKYGEYVFTVERASFNTFFFDAEYGCSGATYVDTFTVTLESLVNANAGSDQVQSCVNTISLIGNSPGAGVGEWALVTSPAGSSPSISDVNAVEATIIGVSTPGTYSFSWTITSPNGGCNSTDTVSFDILSISPDAPSVNATQPLCGEDEGAIEIIAPIYATYQYSIDGTNYQSGTSFINVPTGNYEVTTRIGVDGCISSSTTVNIKTPICGSVYNDANGMSDGIVNGTGTTVDTLYAILYDETTGAVIDVVAVNPDGTYSLGAIKGNAASIYLSTTPATIGQTSVPAITLPTGWANVGEMNCETSALCSGSDGTADGILSLGVVDDPITEANFGVDQAPESDDVTQVIPDLTSNSIPAGWITAGVTGSDPEQGGLDGTNASIIIDDLPSNATMYYNGVLVSLGDTIDNFDPTLLSFEDIDDSATSIVFDYSFIDSAGVKSIDPASYTVSWDTPLFIEMLYFDAYAMNNRSNLKWATATEIHCKGFEIERSTTGSSWTSIGFVPSRATDGSSSETLAYSFIDDKIESEKFYYRLKQMHLNGDYQYSEIRTVIHQKDHSIQIYPNPATSYLVVSGLEGTETIKMYNVAGKLVKEINAQTGEVELPIGDLPAGVYQISIYSTARTLLSEKILKL